MTWKRLLIPLASVPVLLLLAYGFRTDPKAIPSPLVKKPAPEFRLTVFGGGEISLAGLKGKPAGGAGFSSRLTSVRLTYSSTCGRVFQHSTPRKFTRLPSSCKLIDPPS